MSYYNGTVANLSGLLTALTTACVTDGWTYSGGELVKHGCYFTISVDAYSGAYERLRMQIKNPVDLSVSDITSIRDMSNVVISFPAEYHIFTFDKEVYCVLTIQPGKYAWICFGASSISLPGTGAFLSGSCSGATSTTSDPNFPSFFYAQPAVIGVLYQGSRVDTGFSFCSPFSADNISYGVGAGSTSWYSGSFCVGSSQPNAFSGESILTPLMIFAEYSLNRYCLVFQAEHARHIRIDNYEDEQIITYGTDKWMIFPCKKRDMANRTVMYRYDSPNGSGTFGMAIRYEGP